MQVFVPFVKPLCPLCLNRKAENKTRAHFRISEINYILLPLIK